MAIQLNWPLYKLLRKLKTIFAGTEDGALAFTPTLGATTEDGTHLYDQQVGRYTRVANTIFYTIRIEVSTKNNSGTITGDIRINGLPVEAAAAADGGLSPAAVAVFRDITVGADQLTAYVQPGTTVIRLREDGDGASIDESDLGTNPDIVISGFYFV